MLVLVIFILNKIVVRKKIKNTFTVGKKICLKITKINLSHLLPSQSDPKRPNLAQCVRNANLALFIFYSIFLGHISS